MGFSGDYEKFRDRLGDVGLEEYSVHSTTWDSEQKQIHSDIGRLHGSFGYGFSSASLYRETTEGDKKRNGDNNYKEEIVLLLKHKSKLVFRENQLLKIIRQLDSLILIDRLNLYIEELKEAIDNINNTIQKIYCENEMEYKNIYLSDDERSFERKTLVKTIFESIVSYLSTANHDEKPIIKQLISDCSIILETKKPSDASGKSTNISNEVRKYIIEKLELKETQQKCFFCNNNLLSNINYCITCYERKEG